MSTLGTLLCYCLALAVSQSETAHFKHQASGESEDELSLLQIQLQPHLKAHSLEGKHTGHVSGKLGVFPSATVKEEVFQPKNVFERLAYRSHRILSWHRSTRLIPPLLVGVCLCYLILQLRSKSSTPVCSIVMCTLSIFLISIVYICWTISLTYRVEFIHIPKNAGSNIEKVGLAGGIRWAAKERRFPMDQAMPDGNKCSTYHVPPHLNIWHIKYAELTTICVTRHPFDRMVSEYNYLLDEDLQISAVGHAWGHKYAEQYQNGLYTYPPCTDAGLNHFAQTVLKLYKSGQRFIDDCHHIPQVEYIWDPSGKQQCSDIIRIDELPSAFNAVMVRKGYNVHQTEEKSNKADRCPYISMSNFSAETKRMMLDVYADDFKLLNYSSSL
mmetsp:Transcript_48229/g.84837  ORF Transcript_48229/g.84837 Transcript_48229/m.84837 type:complete len:384 (-) Transcript_48229:140-1291(-)